MKNLRNALLVGMSASVLTACGGAGGPTVGSDPETDTFRQGLPSSEDISMAYGANGKAAGALNGDYSLIAGMTAEAVIGTNAFMIGHFAMMSAVADLPPTGEGENYRVWEGEHKNLTLRVRADRKEAPGGTRFDYVLAGKVTDSDADMIPIVDGHVVRLDATSARDGYGIVRFHFTNLNTLEPNRQIGGISRVAFRKVNKAHQVHVRALDIKTPDDPYFPQAAEYFYAVKPNESGALKWFSVGDVKRDGAPYENVAVHSAWRADKSGIGSAVVFDGSLEVDYWHLVECWDSTFIKGYDALSAPELNFESGDATSCFGTPENLEVPEHQETLPNEDPEIPAAMPEEETGE